MENFSTHLENIASTYSTDRIFILGKGPSIDGVKPEAYANAVVIGINDVERVYPVDVSVFHEEWVARSIEDNGCRSRLYLSEKRFNSMGKPVITVPYIPPTQASSDLMMQRFFADELVLEDVGFLTALKIALKIAEIRKMPQTVFMVGFDFDASLGKSSQLGRTYSAEEDQLLNERISIQEFVLLNALYFLRETPIEVKHVGSRSFSAITVDELNQEHAHDIHDSEYVGRVSIVAELTTNHFGDRVRLERMIRAAKSAGADYIKLQKRDVGTFYTRDQLASKYVSPFGKTFAEYRYQLELSKDDFEFVDQLCEELGIGWFASVLDEPSFRFIREFNPQMIKLPSTISEHREYLEKVSREYRGEVVLSTGMTDVSYEEFVLNTFRSCGGLFLLQCNSAYPTPAQDCHIGVVRHYHDLSLIHPWIRPGYSSHDLGWKASALAVAAGAKMIEKHVKLGNTEWAHFDAVAVDLSTRAFADFVGAIRETEVLMGTDEKMINESEHHKYERGGR